MTTYTFQPSDTSQFVDWGSPSSWVGGVVPNSSDADVNFPTVYDNSTGDPYVSFVTVEQGASYSVRSVALRDYLEVHGSLSVSGALNLYNNGEIDMDGGVLNAGSINTGDAYDIQGYGQISVGSLTNDSLIVGSGLTITAQSLINDGTLAASGTTTISVAPGGFSGLTNGTLSTGTLEVLNGSTLTLILGQLITDDAATIMLGGGTITSRDPTSGQDVALTTSLKTVAASGSLIVSGSYQFDQLNVAGSVSLQSGQIGASQLAIAAGGQLQGIGTVTSAVENNGVIAVELPTTQSATTLTLAGAVTGSGSLEVGPNILVEVAGDEAPESATLELSAAVTENVIFEGDQGTLQLDQPQTFTGAISIYAPADAVALEDTSLSSITNTTYVGNSAGGTLTLHEANSSISINFLGYHTLSDFSLDAGPQQLSSDPPSVLIYVATLTAPAQASTLAERTTTTGNALNGDTPAGGQGTLSVNAVSTTYNGGSTKPVTTGAATVLQGAYGVLTINADGSYSYAASAEGETVGASYADPFTVTVADSTGHSASETLTFTSVGSATGDANANTIVGGSGATETIEGLGGADLLITGSAPDVFTYTSAADSPYSATAVTYDTIEGFRSGTDKIDVSAADGGGVELVRNDSGGTPETFVYFAPNGQGGFQDVIDVYGVVQPGDVVVSGKVADVYVYGDATAGQVLDGSAGHSFLISGGASSDTLIGGPDDVLYGGAGTDDFVIPSLSASSASSFDTIVGFISGQDTLDLSAVSGDAVVLAHENGATFVSFAPDANGDGGYQGFLVVQSNVLPSDLKLASGATVTSYLYGTSQAGQSETLNGGAGNLIVEAGAGTDTIYAGPSDTLYAGAGADDFVISTLSASPTSAYDVLAGFKSGTDKLDISAVDGGHVLTQAFDGDTFVYFDVNSSGAYQGVVEVVGAFAASDLVLSQAAQASGVQIVGDTHEAAGATETLTGGAETDYIYAGAGADTLYGKGGADFLVGGAGSDTFAYHAISDSTPSAEDIIDNFDPAKGDTIDLSALDKAAGVNGQFVTAFDGHAGEYELVQPSSTSSYWHVLGDLTGAGSADFEIAFNVTGATTDYQSIQAHIHL